MRTKDGTTIPVTQPKDGRGNASGAIDYGFSPLGSREDARFWHGARRRRSAPGLGFAPRLHGLPGRPMCGQPSWAAGQRIALITRDFGIL
jgi:hypothetical protein